jgi:hypothetical protein
MPVMPWSIIYATAGRPALRAGFSFVGAHPIKDFPAPSLSAMSFDAPSCAPA